MTQREQQTEMLKLLVENALDFLSESTRELENKPKYSVIHFHAAIELILKARLMAEHWTLVVSSKKEADWSNFQSGNFLSVTMAEAASKLQKIIQSGFSDKQLKSFRSVAKHRNRMVHFYHEADTPEANQSQIQAIVKEQLKSWYFLHDLLQNQWRNVFAPWKEKIASLDEKLRQNHEFLRVVFNQLAPVIEAAKKEGYIFVTCPSCGFCADKHQTFKNKPYKSECLVCTLSELCIRIDCPDCGADGSVIFKGEPCAECEDCRVKFDSAALIDVFVDEGEAFLAVKDGGEYPFPAKCGECSGYQTVVEVPGQKYLCVECFTMSEEIGTCEWCNEVSTNLPDNSGWIGCESCDGRAGWDKD